MSQTSFRLNLSFVIILSLIFYSCGMNKKDISPLFEPPTNLEKQLVIKDWESRDLGVYNWQIIKSIAKNGYTYNIISHDVNNYIHYGIVRLPKDYNDKQGIFPLVIANHGGIEGCGLSELNEFEKKCYEDFFIIFPSFIGEKLYTEDPEIGILQSEGPNDIFDKDVDDVLAMLNGVLDNYPSIDTNRISTVGKSRGACVSLISAIRDSRISKVSIFSGVTDHMTFPNIEDLVQNRKTKRGPQPFIIKKYAVTDYQKGNITLEKARLNLLMRSPIHFIDFFPNKIEIQHGTKDNIVLVENSRILVDSLKKYSNIEATYFEYPNGAHLTNMEDSDERNDNFICQ